MKTAAVLLVLLLTRGAGAQPIDTVWTRYVLMQRSGSLSALVDMPDGSVVAAGACCSALCPSAADAAYITRISASGEDVWSIRRWGCEGDSGDNMQVTDLKAVPSGGLIALCGPGRNGTGLWPARLIRMNTEGEILWDRTIADSVFNVRKICNALSNGFAAVIDSPSTIVRLDSTGEQLWQVQLGAPLLNDIAATLDGGFVAVGNDNYMRNVLFAVKVNALGDTVWTRSYRIAVASIAESVLLMPGGTMLIGGISIMTDTLWPRAGCLLALDQQGILLWYQNHWLDPYTQGSESYKSIVPCREGGYIILAGPTLGMLNCSELVRIDNDGNILWTYPVPGSALYEAVAQTADSGFAVVGHWQHVGTLMKFNREGLPVSDMPEIIPCKSSLQAYPNPFNPSTTLAFTLPKSGVTTIDVYDLAGRKVQALADGLLEAGEHQMSFDGSQLPSGLYFARFQSGEFTATQKLLLLK